MASAARTRRAASWLFALAAAGAAQEPSQAPGLEAAGSSSEQPVLTGFEERLADLVCAARGQRLGATALASRLASLGAGAAPALLDAALSARIVRGGGGAAREVALRDGELEAVRGAVRLLGRDPVLPLARAVVERPEEARSGAARRALLGLGLTGGAADLTIAVAVAGSIVHSGAEGLALQRDLERTVEAVARRDRQALQRFSVLLAGGDEATAGSLVRGIAACGQPGALRALVEELDHRNDLAPLLLSEMQRAAQSAPRPIDEPLRSKVRVRLASDAPLVARTAAAAAGALGDFDAVPELIDMLGASDKGVRDSAWLALRALSGLGFDAAPGSWRSWLDRERAWFEAHAARLAREVEGPEAGPALAAMRELTGRRYRRDELAAIAASALQHPNPAVRRGACAAISSLGSMACATELVERLDDEDAEVARAAWSCLTKVSGRDLPPERTAWTRALELRD